MKKNKLPVFEHVYIENVAAEGKSVAKINDKVVFVPFVVPGDVVDIKVKKKKRNFMEAVPVFFHEYSKLRVEPRCKHFGVCGGCKWQSLNYKEQIKAKQQQVVDALIRIGKVNIPDVCDIIGCEQIYEYRNKLEFGFSDKRWLTNNEIDENVKYDKPEKLEISDEEYITLIF